MIGTATAVIGGYAFGRFRFPFKNTLLFGLLWVRVLPPIAVLTPYFVILSALRLIGTYVGLTVTYLTAVVPLLTWVLMGYFASLPIEIERAARIDGCGRLRALWDVIIPMAMPGIAAAFVVAFLTAWNELLFGVVLTGGTAKQTRSPALLAFSPTMPSTGAATLGMTLFAAGSVRSTVPPLILALLVQRYITRLQRADPVTRLMGGPERERGVLASFDGDPAVLRHRRGAAAAGRARRHHGGGGAVLGEPRRVRRHPHGGHHPGAGPVTRPGTRPQRHGADASPWRDRGGCHRAGDGVSLDLLPPQCRAAAARAGLGRDHAFVAGRSRTGGGLQLAGAADGAGLGI